MTIFEKILASNSMHHIKEILLTSTTKNAELNDWPDQHKPAVWHAMGEIMDEQKLDLIYIRCHEMQILHHTIQSTNIRDWLDRKATKEKELRKKNETTI